MRRVRRVELKLVIQGWVYFKAGRKFWICLNFFIRLIPLASKTIIYGEPALAKNHYGSLSANKVWWCCHVGRPWKLHSILNGNRLACINIGFSPIHAAKLRPVRSGAGLMCFEMSGKFFNVKLQHVLMETASSTRYSVVPLLLECEVSALVHCNCVTLLVSIRDSSQLPCEQYIIYWRIYFNGSIF